MKQQKVIKACVNLLPASALALEVNTGFDSIGRSAIDGGLAVDQALAVVGEALRQLGRIDRLIAGEDLGGGQRRGDSEGAEHEWDEHGELHLDRLFGW